MAEAFGWTKRPAGVFRIAATLVLAAGLAACAHNPLSKVAGGHGKHKASDAPPKEQRISILALDETLETDPRLAGAHIDLPPAYRNVSWPEPGGEADHTLHHLTGVTTLDKVWSAKIGKGATLRSRLTSPPVAADGRVFVVDTDAEVSAFDMKTGRLQWRSKLAPKVRDKFRLRDIAVQSKPQEIGFGGGVAYDDGLLFVTSGFGFAAALDATTGKEMWRYQAQAPVRTPPTAYRGDVFFVTNTNNLIALDEKSGAEKWTYQSFEETARILSSSSPAAAGDLLVAPFSSGELSALIAENGHAVWNDTLSKNSSLTPLSALNDIAGAPVIDRGLVYVVSHGGRFAAIDIRSGQRLWEIPIAGLQMPWVAGDYIFIVSVDSELVCVRREDGAVAWISKLRRYAKEKKRKGRIAWAGPVLAGDHLILVSSAGEIIRVSAQTGEVEQRRRIGAGVVVPPIVADDKAFVLTDKGQLIAYK